MNSELIQSSMTDTGYIKFVGNYQIFAPLPHLNLLNYNNNCISYRACIVAYDLSPDQISYSTNACGTITVSASENLATLFSQAAKYFQQYSTTPHLNTTSNMLLNYGKDENKGYFCDGTCWNAVPKALSQNDASQNDVPEPFFSCHRYNEVRRVLLSYHSSF
jgi:hypothetical protein